MKQKIKHRPPIVTLMGHVDHGKTSLLDAIRKSNIAGGEHGQITQHIGAYTVETHGKKITFLDTPGHEAFTAMRSRGAQVTDIVVLVVAVNEGLMPQTIEAIHHCQAAEVPVIVALNKVDKGKENIPRIKSELAKHNILSEELGGQTLFVETVASKGTGVNNLLEAILLQAEMLELVADDKAPAEGVAIETRLDRGTGPNITLLVLKGILRPRESFLVGNTCGKVRALFDDRGKPLKEVSPGMAARVVGLEELPAVGAPFLVVESDKIARGMVEQKLSDAADATVPAKRATLEELYQRLQTKEIKELNVILKADVSGSLEALTESLLKITSEEVKLNLVHTGVGPVLESDVLLAETSDSIVLGFHVPIEPKAKAIAQHEKVQVRLYNIIYDLLEDVRKSLSGLLEPEIKEVITGKALVKQIFELSNNALILGSNVLEGKITRGSKARLIRAGKEVLSSTISSLRRFKNDAREVLAGYECGIGLEGAKGVEIGDIIITFQLEEVSRSV